MKNINLKSIRIDGGTQSRARLNQDVVAEYAEAIADGAKLPPVTVFHDGAEHWLADGFHRYHAHAKAGKVSIAAEIIPGTQRMAKLHSFGANGAHGLRRTNEDKRQTVQEMLDDAEWTQWSDRKIADQCGVSHTLVALMRRPKVATLPHICRERGYKPGWKQGGSVDHREYLRALKTVVIDSGGASFGNLRSELTRRGLIRHRIEVTAKGMELICRDAEGEQ